MIVHPSFLTTLMGQGAAPEKVKVRLVPVPAPGVGVIVLFAHAEGLGVGVGVGVGGFCVAVAVMPVPEGLGVTVGVITMWDLCDNATNALTLPVTRTRLATTTRITLTAGRPTH